jgi:hypothetical protein
VSSHFAISIPAMITSQLAAEQIVVAWSRAACCIQPLARKSTNFGLIIEVLHVLLEVLWDRQHQMQSTVPGHAFRDVPCFLVCRNINLLQTSFIDHV